MDLFAFTEEPTARKGAREKVRSAPGRFRVLNHGEPWVDVRLSSIPRAGRGVFAARAFREGDVIGFYLGRVIGWDGLGIGGDYVRVIETHPAERGVCVDGAQCPQSRRRQARRLEAEPLWPAGARSHWPGAYMHLVNDFRGSNRRVNCRVGTNGVTYAARDLRPGEELLVDYGAGYWEQ